jgi:hypothetical protein
MDENQYRRLKTQLPYIVGSVFIPAIRRKENFAYANYFIIDIDHVGQFNRSVDQLKKELQIDDRILLMFISPGNDGLKLLFRLSNKIHDPSYFTVFYKHFASRFAIQHQLEGMVDIKTHDTSRCCFMSHDKDAWYFENATAIDSTDYVNQEDVNDVDKVLFEIKSAIKEQNRQLSENQSRSDLQNASELSGDILMRIKARINPEKIQKRTKEVYQPMELEEVWHKLTEYLTEMEIHIEKMIPISYGRQIRISALNYWAEINIFFGKKGFSIVTTTKTGSDPALAKLAKEALQQFFNQHD